VRHKEGKKEKGRKRERGGRAIRQVRQKRD
jgi:hypothetical protein